MRAGRSSCRETAAPRSRRRAGDDASAWRVFLVAAADYVARTYVPRPLQSSAGIIFDILIRHSLAGSMVRSRSAEADNSASAAWRAFAVNRPIRPELASVP